ncbi:MAG TPA: type II secretion system ATPase GspE [Polyangiaceae bacterium]|nr:type II secretion system ATPase GspE [Polyangiaceae bacterium]
MNSEQVLGQVLVRHGVLSDDALAQVLEQQREKPVGLWELIVAMHMATDLELTRALAKECALPVVESIDIDTVQIAAATRLPIGYAKNHRVLVVREDDQSVDVVCGDPLDVEALDAIRAQFDKPTNVHVTVPDVVVDAINRVYERQQTTDELKSEDGAGEEEEVDILESDDDAPVIRWVNSLFFQAVKERASDIHIEPEEKEVIVRYRIDGELYVARRASRQFLSAVLARVKIMAGLNIAEKRLPQDGRISLKIAGRSLDIRVSTVPTSRDSERIVMRLLHKTNILLELSELGFAERDYQLMHQLIERPDGIILVTGPTGSGKTTTLYACLNRINRPNVNILTAEDPVEYEIGGIHQVPVQPKIGLTFASALRAFLRQDPDVIMVGEIRDKETAEIAIHASMTGHLVLSTLHTNDAAGAVTRLVEMEMEPFLVRSTVIGILAQRLVRRLCEKCREPYEASPWDLEQLGLDPERNRWRKERKVNPRYVPHGVDLAPLGWWGPGMPTFYRPKGCAQCDQKGFTGRIGIYELLVIEDVVGNLILQKADAQNIKRAAQVQGMDSLRDDGARKVLLGKTTVEEVVAATQEDIIVDE